MRRMLPRPCDQCFIHFTRIPLPLLVFSYPDTNIECSRFEKPESSTAEESTLIFRKDEVLEIFSLPYLLLSLSHIFELFLIGRGLRYDIEITIRLRKFHLQLLDIHSSIEGEWHKDSPSGFDAGSGEGEMRIFE